MRKRRPWIIHGRRRTSPRLVFAVGHFALSSGALSSGRACCSKRERKEEKRVGGRKRERNHDADNCIGSSRRGGEVKYARLSARFFSIRSRKLRKWTRRRCRGLFGTATCSYRDCRQCYELKKLHFSTFSWNLKENFLQKSNILLLNWLSGICYQK